MRESRQTDEPVASWLQLEHAVERLHRAAREPLSLREFYRRLIDEASAAIGALGGAAWRVSGDGRVELICQSIEPDAEIEVEQPAARLTNLCGAIDNGEAAVRTVAADTGSYECVICPIGEPATSTDDQAKPRAAAVFELWLAAGASPLLRQGWLELATTIADVAADFHALDELRRLREGESLHRQAIDLLRRVQTPHDLVGAAFELANEGRRVLGCNRLCVLIRRGGRWRLLAASGAARVQRRSDFARRAERLAHQAAKWGEPIFYPADSAESELPPSVARSVEEHVDHSHARELACIPLTFAAPSAGTKRRRAKFDAVLIAESFEGAGPRGQAPRLASQLVELGELCGPALARAAALDRFPLRTMLRWSDRLAVLRQPARLAKALPIVGALAAAVAALIYVPADFDVEAPGALGTVVERDVFASATGSIAELHATHGAMVNKGDVLLVLSDPELALKLQQVRGEIDATRRRLDALAVTRTDRTLRENQSDDRLPLSAEQRQLEEQLASLEIQRTLLETRRESLTLRSPTAGQVLTHDVAKLLESRPVERGEVLLTVADVTSGWQIIADVPQRHIGHVLDAKNQSSKGPTASYRLVGDVEKTYPARVIEVSAAAPLEPAGLEDEAAPVEVRIAIDGQPPTAARPGMSASVRIHCGQRALGYVWLHDAAATVYRWITF
jgi:multidrug efflux pump subunit AcrA (membrane-fusion protein)